MELQAIETATAAPALACNLFDVTTGCENRLDAKPRNANEEEVRAYFDWLRRRANLPDLGKPSLDCGSYSRGYKTNPTCRGATFGKQLAPAKWEGQACTPAQFENGAYSIPMPGYSRTPARVTFETLDEAGEVLAISTLPVEPKKGGVIWTTADVRKAHGPCAKPAKAGRSAPAPIEEIEPAVIAATVADPAAFDRISDYASAVAGTRQWFVGRWSSRTRERYEFRFTQAEYTALEQTFEAAHGTSYPDAVEPVQRESEPVPPATLPPAPEIASSGAEIDHTAAIETGCDPLADVLARLEALEAAIATLPVESAAAPIVAKRERSPSHERAVRRAWQMRAQRDLDVRALDAGAAYCRKLEAERDALREDNARITPLQHALVDAGRTLESAERKRRKNALHARQRAREMVAAVNLMHDQVDALAKRNAVLEADLAKLRADMADPSQPERASDVAQLMRERDQARTANAALLQRCERAEAARDTLAGHVEAMGLRLANAEAAVRRLAVAA